MTNQAPSVMRPSPATVRERGPDRHTTMARRLVVHNYNSHHRRDVRPLRFTDTYITWFSSSVNGWTAVVASTSVRGLIWEVSFDSEKSEAHIVIWRKVNNVVVRCEEEQN